MAITIARGQPPPLGWVGATEGDDSPQFPIALTVHRRSSSFLKCYGSSQLHSAVWDRSVGRPLRETDLLSIIRKSRWRVRRFVSGGRSLRSASVSLPRTNSSSSAIACRAFKPCDCAMTPLRMAISPRLLHLGELCGQTLHEETLATRSDPCRVPARSARRGRSGSGRGR
jgi:hypothetical protein